MQNTYKKLVTQAFPKILCVGKNYLEHVKEMGGKTAKLPTKPLIFLKPWSSLAYNPQKLDLPVTLKRTIDHEVQLGVLISKGGKNIHINDAMGHVGGYFLGLDLTDRDYQTRAKEKSFPWELSKGQDNFCPVSPLIDGKIDPYSVLLQIKVNGQTKQKDYTKNMHFKIDQMISYISEHMTLNDGDLILTGTPQGVDKIVVGDKIQATASIDDKVVAQLKFLLTG